MTNYSYCNSQAQTSIPLPAPLYPIPRSAPPLPAPLYPCLSYTPVPPQCLDQQAQHVPLSLGKAMEACIRLGDRKELGQDTKESCNSVKVRASVKVRVERKHMLSKA